MCCPVLYILAKLFPGRAGKTDERLRFIYPYDEGVFLYARRDPSLPRVSTIQACLNLYARRGRDLKQADLLLENAIVPRCKGA
jgi:hypothetical protein